MTKLRTGNGAPVWQAQGMAEAAPLQKQGEIEFFSKLFSR
jgi:hypothetical protein